MIPGRTFVPIAVALLTLALAGSAGAQAPGGAGADSESDARNPGALRGADRGEPLLAGPVDAERYRLGPGDMLSLELAGRAARQTSLTVDAEGRANIPEMGVVDVAGRTLADVRTQVLRRLRAVYPGARVELRLTRVRTFKVYISGQVREPGAGSASGATRASELFRDDFALLPDASRRNIDLRRRDGTRQRVDLDAFALLGRSETDPYLDDGDVLVVPPRRERVFALGAFARPGEYELAPGDSISDLVELAGGLLPGADGEPGSLVRFVTATVLDSFPVDLAAAVAGRGDRMLQHQDRLFARQASDYRRTRNVTLFGEVGLPGPYAVRGGEDRLAAVIARAGGLTSEADSQRIQVFRPGAQSGQRDIEFERLSRLDRSEMSDAEYIVFQTKLASQQAAFIVSARDLSGVHPAFDVRLEDGDVVVVDRQTRAVRVAGEVRRPALVEFTPGHTGKDYILLAGGFTRRARRGDIRVSRPGSSQTLLLDDVGEIRAGDFIWVPEKKQANFWGVLKDVILVAGSAATVIILVRNETK